MPSDTAFVNHSSESFIASRIGQPTAEAARGLVRANSSVM